MYYVFKPTINLKAEADVTGNFNLFMDFPNVVLETKKELTDIQIEGAKTKVKNLLRTKFGMTNIELEIINIIN